MSRKASLCIENSRWCNENYRDVVAEGQKGATEDKKYEEYLDRQKREKAGAEERMELQKRELAEREKLEAEWNNRSEEQMLKKKKNKFYFGREKRWCCIS